MGILLPGFVVSRKQKQKTTSVDINTTICCRGQGRQLLDGVSQKKDDIAVTVIPTTASGFVTACHVTRSHDIPRVSADANVTCDH